MKRSPVLAVVWILILWLIPWSGHHCTAGQLDTHGNERVGAPAPDVFQLITAPGGRLTALTADPGGLFVSEDGGRRWRRAEGLPDTFLYALADDFQGGLFLATDQGLFHAPGASDRWRRVSMTRAAILAFSPDGAGIVKIWGKGLFRARRDALISGAHEALEAVSGLPDAPVQSVVLGPGGMAFAGIFGAGVFGSRDGGQSFQEMNHGLDNRDVVVLGMSKAGTLLAGTYGGGIFRWSPDTAAWHRTGDVAGGGIVQCLAPVPGGGMLAGTRQGGVAVSRDDGKSWSPLPAIHENANVHAVAAGEDGTIWAGVDGEGLAVLRSGESVWVQRPFADLSTVLQLTADPVAGTWYAGVKGLGLLRTATRGAAWTPVRLPFPYDDKVCLMVHDGRLFVGRPDAGPFVSSDGGGWWEKAVLGLPDDGVHSLRCDGSGNAFAVSADGRGLFRLTTGDAWRQVAADDEDGTSYSAWDLVFLPGGEAAAYGYNDVLLSYGGQGSWRRHRFGQAFKSLWVDARGTLWTRRMLTTFALTEDGRQWESREDAAGSRYTAFSPLPPDHVVAVAMGGGLAVLRPQGSALAPMGAHLQDRRVHALAVDRDRTILAGTDRGLWISPDRGRSWREIDLQP